ncbi:hypothetical protein DQS71_24055, partial [Salmonella enterica subsp. enterica]|nr:hypothetical protein [Salmonella enterica subsp. enterica serovar Alachua]EBW6349709.1 hypothetical protein [Salmonella enterica subsp. enterica serovar Alachua]EBX3054106.1 hypothetical protein [Salmonella enterica subsp. enterica serovar Alachua]
MVNPDEVMRQIRQYGVLGIFRPKTTKCSGGPAVCGLQRGITFFEIPIWALFEGTVAKLAMRQPF